MKKLIIFATTIFFSLNLKAENVEVFQLSTKLNDSTYLFIDNSESVWYTIEIQTDTLFSFENGMYFANNKPMQFLALGFDNRNPRGTRGNPQAEKSALQSYKRTELAHHRRVIGRRLRSDEELFYSQSGKPFLIWWYENPRQRTRRERQRERTVEFYTDTSQMNFEDKEFIELNATHQLFLTFNIHGNVLVAISVPVFENEKLQDEIQKLKNMAHSLNVYGGPIDLPTLFKRLENPNYVFRDDANLIEIEIPSWLNVVVSPHWDIFLASFPERHNLTNAVAVTWRSKSSFEDFDDFINNFQLRNPDANSFQLLKKEKNEVRDFYTSLNGWRSFQRIFIEGEKAFYFIVFTGTETTYYFNLPKFYELMERITFR